MPDFLDEFIAGNPAKQSRRGKSGTLPPDNSRIQAIHDGANALGIDPLDYATVISYESAGTFDPWKAGPTTKWGQHRGTIQYGEPQRREFGVYKGQTFEDQVTTSNVNYLKKAGVKPGADLLTIYKAINGGSVKASANASDGYGTIGGHVQRMMGAHRTKAAKFLGNSYDSQNSTGNNALDSFINQSANNAPANIDDFINAPVGEQTAPMLGAAPEQTVDSVSPLYPAPASQAAPKPVPESDFTIGEQIQSALKPDSPRAAVLMTEPNQAAKVPPEFAALLFPVQTPNGTLMVNRAKASSMGLPTPLDVDAYVKAHGFASLIGHVEDVGNNTGEGIAVQTKSPDGQELVTSVATTPEAANEQLLNHQKQFEGKIGKQEILPVTEAIQAREQADIANLGKANVGATNFGAEPAPERMPADYFEYLKARESVDSPELRNEYASTKQTNPEAYNQAPEVQASVPAQQERVARQSAPAQKGQILPEAQSAPIQSPTTFAPGSYDNIQRETFGTIQPSKIYREKPTAEQYLADAQRETYGANFDAANEAARRLTGEPLIDYSAEVSQADIDSGFNPNTGKVEGLQVAGSEKVRRAVEAFEKGGEEGLKNALPQLNGNANPAPPEPERDPDALLRAQAENNIYNSPFATHTEEEVEAEFQRLRNSQIDPETAEQAKSDAAGLNENLGSAAASAIGGYMGGVGRVFRTMAGISRPLSSLGIEAPYELFSKIARKSEILDENTGDGGAMAQLIKIGAGTPTDIARIAGLSRLPGGMVVGFAADNALQSAGRGESLEKIAKEGAKGAALGGVFGVAGKVGGAVEKTLQKNLVNVVDAFPSNAAYKAANLTAKVFGEVAEIGTIGTGTLGIEKAAGATDKEAAHSAIFNGLFHIANKVGAKAYDKVYKIWENGKAETVYVDPDGGVKLLRGEVEPQFVDAEIISDPTSKAYQAADAAKNVTPREKQLVKVKTETENETSPDSSQSLTVKPTVGATVEAQVKTENGRNIVKTGTVTELVQERGKKPAVEVEFADGTKEIVPERKTSVIRTKNDGSITLPSNKEIERISATNGISAPETALQSNEIESRYKNLPTQKLQEVKVEKPVAKVITTTRPSIAEKLNVFTERGTKAAIEPKVIDSSEILTSLDEGYPQELQPRDRSRAASKAQISEIANKLNPEFLGDSPKASDGRPLVIPVELDGQTKYAVISGNGRTAGIREAYNLENEGSQKYAEFARSKSDTSAKQPVYVGILDAGEIKNLPEFAKEANESATAQMSATEQAKSDAERLDGDVLNLFVPSDDGTIHGAANRDFTRAFLQRAVSTSEQGRLVDAEGKLNQDGSIRVRNAIFARAFGDSESGLAAITRMSESTDNTVKNITNGLLAKSGSLAALREAAKTGTRHKEFDIAPDLARSMEKYASLKDTGTSVEEYIQQGNLFGAETTPFQTRVMQVFDAHKRSPKAIRSIISNFLDLAEEAGDPNQSNLFGEKTNLDIKSQFEAAVTTYERENSKSEQSDQSGLFGDQGIQLRQTADESGTSNTPNPDSENTGNRDGREAFAQKPGSQELGQPLYKKTSEQVGKETAKESENSTKIVEIEKERAREIQAAQKEAFRLPFISNEKGERLKLNRLVNVDFVTPSGRTLSKTMKAADRQNGLRQKENIFQKLLGSVNSQGDATTLKNGIKKLGKSIDVFESEELEQSYDSFTADGMSVYDASINALTDYHKNLFNEVNELRAMVDLPLGEYKAFDERAINAKYDRLIKDLETKISVPPSSYAQDVSVAQSPQEATAETDIDNNNRAVQNGEPDYLSDDRMTESKLVGDIISALEKDITLDTLKNARIEPSGKINEEAYGLLARANQKVWGGEIPLYTGAFLNPNNVGRVRSALRSIFQNVQSVEAKAEEKRILGQFDAAVSVKGGMKQIVSSASVPDGLKQAWQEETGHEVDYFFGNKHQISEEIFPADKVGRKAITNLSNGAYKGTSHTALAIEVGAKIWRDDAETALGLSKNEIEHLQNLQVDALIDAGKTLQEIKREFARISDSARKFTENYEPKSSRQRDRTFSGELKRDGESEIPRPIRAETEGTRGSAERPADLLRQEGNGRTAENRQNQDLDKYKKPENTELKRFKREENPARGPGNRGSELLNPARRGNGSLVKHEIAIVERRFKKDPEKLKAAKDEILYARASVPQTKTGAGLMKIGKGAVDIISAPKSLMSSFDISAPGRQGAVLSLSEPRIAARAFVEQIKSFRKVNYDNFVRDLNLHPFVEMAEASGLYLSTLSDQDALGKREEAFMSRLLGEEDYIKNKVGEKIRRTATWHVRVSERAYLTYLDSLRINSFEKLAKQVNEYNLRKGLDKDEIVDAENNVTRLQDQMTALAEFVNYATGRGSLGVFEDAAGVLNAGMFSPRYIMSRLQLLNPAFYAKLPPGVRNIALKKMLGFAGATAVIMGLLKLAGGEVELGDPEESDFLMKVKFGAFHYDFGAGFAQPVRYLARMIAATKSRVWDGKPLNAYGKIDKKGFGESKESSMTKQFARTKLSPALGSAINLYTGTNMVGEKSTLGSEASNLLLPMIANDVQKAFETDGSLGAAKMLPSLLGIGTGVYDKKKKKKEPEERAEREEKPEKPEK